MTTRRQFLLFSSLVGGAGAGALCVQPAAAQGNRDDQNAIEGISSILGVPSSKATDLWEIEDIREYLPVSVESWVRAKREPASVGDVTDERDGSAGVSEGVVEPLAAHQFILAAGHNFKNLWGNVLFSATLSKVTNIGGAYATKVSTRMTYRTTPLGLALWVPRGVQSSRSIDRRQGTSHYSERVASWVSDGGSFPSATVSLVVGALVRNDGTYVDTKKTEKPPWI